MANEQTGLDFCYEKDGLLIFDSSNKTDENIYLSDKTTEELKEIYKILPNCDVIDIDIDLSPVDNLKFKDGAEVYLHGTDDLPKNMDISNCSVVELSGRDLSQIQPQKLRDGSTFIYTNKRDTCEHFNNLRFDSRLDISGCDTVTMLGINLENISDMKFRDNAAVTLSRCSDLPKNLDVSNCRYVRLNGCDLSSIKNLKFKEGADVDLAYCQSIPADIDISRCSSIDLSGNDLSKINSIRFAEDASVNLSKCQNIPAYLDISNCDEIDLSGCDLSKIKNIKFKDGAKVNLSGCKNIPEDLDVSKCNEVNLSYCKLSHIDNLQLKDGVKINFNNSQLPKNVDFSKCKVLSLKRCDLSQTKEVKFRKGADVYIGGCENIPDNLDVSMCREVWMNLSHATSINMGNAHIVLNSIQSGKLDFSNLNNNFSVHANNEAFDDKYGGNTFSFVGVDEIVFRDKEQYQDFLKRGQQLPERITVSFSKESVKKTMKRDHENAQDSMRRKQSQVVHNQPERTGLKAAMKRKPVQNNQIPQYQQNKKVEHNSSIKVVKPLIFQKIKRQNG